MKIKAIGQWSTEMLGNVSDGDILDLDPFMAEQFIQRGYAAPLNPYETKVVKQTPVVGDVPLASGPGNDVSSSPAAPASQPKTARSSRAKKQSS